ncbi:MAG: glycosyl hydrolase [Eubacteriales bacterium]|jgi:hypothetical protein
MSELFEMLNAYMQNPPPRYNVSYTWIWNSQIDDNETKKQIDQMEEAGIKSFYILPEPKDFRPYTSKTDMSPDYLTPEFWECVDYAIKYAVEKGMTVWLYDEGGWPSGSACTQINRSLSGAGRKCIQSESIMLESGKPFHEIKCLSAFKHNTDIRINFGDVFDNDTTVDVYRAVELSGKYNTDIADSRVCEKFIQLTHEGYKKIAGDEFGKSIPLIFDDEPGLERYPWTDGFKDEFMKRYGYDICDYLPYITNKMKCSTEKQVQACCDYRRIIGQLVNENFFRPIQNWCHKNNIASAGHLNLEHNTAGFVGSMAYGNPMNCLRSFDIPGVDVIWRQLWINPETRNDHCIDFFPRYASSAAAQTGSREALAECLAVYGDGVTLDQIRGIVNSLAVRGINLFNFFGLSYGKKQGYRLVERPTFDPLKPGFKNLKRLNTVLARLSMIMHIGKPDINCALYLPVEDIFAGGEFSDSAVEYFNNTGSELEDKHVDFDIIDDDFIRASDSIKYTTVIIPQCKRMPDDVRLKLSKIRQSDPEPVINCVSPELRIHRRVTEVGDSIILIVNEGVERVNEVIHIADDRKCYRIDIDNGKIYKNNTGNIHIDLDSGREAVFVYTNDTAIETIAVEELQREAIFTHELIDFNVSVFKDFRITQEGICCYMPEQNFIPIKLGSWRSYLGEDFSGEVIYSAQYTLPFEPEHDMTALISLSKVEYTAEVIVNGKSCGIYGFSGDTIETKLNDKHIKLEIIVSNTASNQCVTADVEKWWDKSIIGPYHHTQLKFEKETLGGGLFGPVTISVFK